LRPEVFNYLFENVFKKRSTAGVLNDLEIRSTEDYRQRPARHCQNKMDSLGVVFIRAAIPLIITQCVPFESGPPG
jgi:hypothetical protein